MRKFYTLLSLTFYVITANYAQTISGNIIDGNSKEKLIGVNIIDANGSGTATDIDGRYSLKLSVGKHIITYRYIGYEEQKKEIILNQGENKTINISLSFASKELSTVVVSAGKFEQKLEEITVSMEVIRPDLIENKNTTNIQTAIDQVPGVNITDGQANIRGGSGWSFGAGTRVLVMVDDMPMISGDAGQVQWKLIATENIGQVEIIKGAASALYGSSALNGVINIRTAFPSQKDIDKNKLPGFTKVNMHFGLIDKAKRDELNWNGEKRRAFKGIEFLQMQKLGNLDLTLGGNIFKDDGYRMGEITDRKRVNFSLKYKDKHIQGLAYGINGNFLFQSSGSAIIWESLEEAYIPNNREITNTNGNTYNIDPFITYFSGNNKWSVHTRYLNVVNDNSTNGADSEQDNQSEIFYKDIQWQKSFDTIGLVATTGFTEELVLARSDLFQGSNIRYNQSLYAQLDQSLGRLNLSLGCRFEKFYLSAGQNYFINGDSTNFITASKPVFRTGLNYRVAEETYLRTSWGQGFRFPSMAEMFISTDFSGFRIYPNPELKPESGWSAELGIKQGVKIGKWMGYLDVATFLMRYNDMMEFSFDKWGNDHASMSGYGFKSVNVGETQISGVETSISGFGKIIPQLTINYLAGYTYMHPISLTPNDVYAYLYNDYGEVIDSVTYNNSSSDSSVLKYRYKHIAKFDAEIIYKGFAFGLSCRYNDFMRNIDKIFTSDLVNNGDPFLELDAAIPGINDAREKFKQGDFIMDCRLAYQINDMAKLSFVVDNVFNREYMSRPADMRPPRTFALQLGLKI